MTITINQMAAAMPHAAAAGRLTLWYPHIVSNMAKYEISRTAPRQAMFLANMAEETGELAAQEENLRYSGERLRQVFPSMFARDPSLADQLAAQGPEAIANYIYADANRPAGYRMGNVSPGDGWKFRGRGGMMTTGRNNYERLFRAIGLPADTDPDRLLEPEIGALSAALYWKTRGCNEMADLGNFTDAVRAVNGGTINMAKRLHYLQAFQNAMAGS